MSLVVRRAIVALAIVGFASAATSTYVHYQLAQDPGYTSFCDINESVSCTQVYLSRYGSVGPIPVALLGAFWFGLVLLLTVAGGRGSPELGENIGTSTLLAGWNAAVYVAQIEDERLAKALNNGSYIEPTREILQHYNGLWFQDESFVVERKV